MSFELKTENCLYMDCGGCVNDESTAEEKQACANGVMCSKFVNDEYIHMSDLGENARRLLEIGIVQDELVKLGFEAEHHSPSAEFKSIYSFMFNKSSCSWIYCNIYFSDRFAHINGTLFKFYYTSPAWQEDLLTCVKGLIK